MDPTFIFHQTFYLNMNTRFEIVGISPYKQQVKLQELRLVQFVESFCHTDQADHTSLGAGFLILGIINHQEEPGKLHA